MTDPVRVAEEIEQVLGFPAEDAILVSAKTGQGIDELITKLCDQLPAPKGKKDAPTRARERRRRRAQEPRPRARRQRPADRARRRERRKGR